MIIIIKKFSQKLSDLDTHNKFFRLYVKVFKEGIFKEVLFFLPLKSVRNKVCP